MGAEGGRRKFHGTIEESDGKFRTKGTVATEVEKNEIWAAIKTIPRGRGRSGRRHSRDWRSCACTGAGGQTGARATAGQDFYTVKAGDTLSRIAKEHLGSANDYMQIFNINKVPVGDPDLIKLTGVAASMT
jgi:nucleoid-associated protein YgaU